MVTITYHQIDIQFNVQNGPWLPVDWFCRSCDLGLFVTVTAIKVKVHTTCVAEMRRSRVYHLPNVTLVLISVTSVCVVVFSRSAAAVCPSGIVGAGARKRTNQNKTPYF